MTEFEKFGDYMFSLLLAPLKKVRRQVNQFYIFFRVVGRIFDAIKADIFTVREEANIASASAALLPVHGQDRAMPRFEGETWQLYRTRLIMKGIVAKQAGTREGIVSLVKSLGYTTVRIEPLYRTDVSRWAEATVWVSGGQTVIDDREIIQQEINKIKPGTNLITLAHEQIYSGTVWIGLDTEVYKIIEIKQV